MFIMLCFVLLLNKSLHFVTYNGANYPEDFCYETMPKQHEFDMAYKIVTAGYVKPGFHYPSWRAVNTASGNCAPVNTARVDG